MTEGDDEGDHLRMVVSRKQDNPERAQLCGLETYSAESN